MLFTSSDVSTIFANVLKTKHYSDQLGQLQQTDKVLEESGLADIDKNVTHAEVIYLKEKGFIDGKRFLGSVYPPNIIITSYEVDAVVIRMLDRSRTESEFEDIYCNELSKRNPLNR